MGITISIVLNNNLHYTIAYFLYFILLLLLLRIINHHIRHYYYKLRYRVHTPRSVSRLCSVHKTNNGKTNAPACSSFSVQSIERSVGKTKVNHKTTAELLLHTNFYNLFWWSRVHEDMWICDTIRMWIVAKMEAHWWLEFVCSLISIAKIGLSSMHDFVSHLNSLNTNMAIIFWSIGFPHFQSNNEIRYYSIDFSSLTAWRCVSN